MRHISGDSFIFIEKNESECKTAPSIGYEGGCRLGEQLEQVMDTHGDYLLRVAYLYMKDPLLAEEIVQDVFVSYYEKQAQFQGQSALRTYLVKITVNRCHDYFRSWAYKRTVLLEKLPLVRTTRTPEQYVVEETERMRLTEAIFALPLNYREVIVLYYYEELNTVGIAEMLDCPEATVRTRLQRARKLLREQLAEDDWEGLLHDEI